MHELAHGGAICSRMHRDPQCRVNVLLQQGKKVRRLGVISSNEMDTLCPPTHPPSYILAHFYVYQVYPWNGRLGSLPTVS
jgi:hypothetical protein